MTTEQTIQLVSVICTTLLGLSGMTVAIVKMILDHKERRSHFRQAVYAKQVEGYQEIGEAARKCFFAPDPEQAAFEDAHGRELAGENEVRSWEDFFDALAKWESFMPSALQEAASDFSNYNWDPKKRADVYKQFMAVIRACIGTDPLTHDVLGLLGSHERISKLREGKWKNN